jgi:hypothetical protein
MHLVIAAIVGGAIGALVAGPIGAAAGAGAAVIAAEKIGGKK